VFDSLQVYDRWERLAVGTADVALRLLTAPLALRRPAVTAAEPARLLVLRLERIGDLLMAFEALMALRRSLPRARITLVVGSWNASLAQAMGVADDIEVLNAPWLARGAAGTSWRDMMGRTRLWRLARFDVANNVEPDIRSNVLLGLSGAPRRIGFFTGGGGPLLTSALAYEPRAHTSANAIRLVHSAVGIRPLLDDVGAPARLVIPQAQRERASAVLAQAAGRPLIGIHPSGGRPVKQWHPSRFAEVATVLARESRAAIVLTGTNADAPIVAEVRASIPADVQVLDLTGNSDLLELAAVLELLAVFVTGGTGPMHLAAAVGTPVVGVFGPSDQVRYAPRSPGSRVVRIDLPCSPCNRIRLPPERCRGHVPDCLDGISVSMVTAAARDLMSQSGSPAVS
jgi:ADP-heptose:LPS heptosyltransferase